VASPSPQLSRTTTTIGAADGGEAATFGLQPTQPKGQPFRANIAMSLKPGQTASDSVRVQNRSTKSLTLKVYASDAYNAENGAIDILPSDDRPSDAGSWVTLERNEVTLASGDFVDIPFTVKVPAGGSEPGDHTAGIVASYVAPQTDQGNPVLVDYRIGTQVQIRIAGTLTPKLQISDLKTTWTGTNNPVGRGTMDVSYTVRNVGNIRLAATQQIQVKSPIGLPSTTVRPPNVPELLPGNSIKITQAVDGVWPTFRSTTKVSLTPQATRDGDRIPAELKVAASAANWTIPGAFLILCLVGAALLWFQRRRAEQRRAMEEARLAAAFGVQLGDPTAAQAAGYHPANGNGRPATNGNGHRPATEQPTPAQAPADWRASQ
jgi:hypothetical protein